MVILAKIPIVTLTKILANIPIVILTKILANIPIVNLTKIVTEIPIEILAKIPVAIIAEILAKIPAVILTKIIAKIPVVILTKILSKIFAIILTKIPLLNTHSNSYQDSRRESYQYSYVCHKAPVEIRTIFLFNIIVVIVSKVLTKIPFVFGGLSMCGFEVIEAGL